MKNMLNKVKESKGFVSLEVIAIAVIIIALAAFILFKFRFTAQNASKSGDDNVTGSVTAVTTDGTATSAIQAQGGK